MNFVLFPHFPSNNKLKPLIPKFHNLKTTITHLNYKGQLRFPTTLAKKNKYQNTKYQNNQNTKTIACKNIQSNPKQRIFIGVCFSPLLQVYVSLLLQLVGPTNCGSHQLVRGRKHTPITGYTSSSYVIFFSFLYNFF